ncbi:MAG TPA: nucleoside hydrolase [Candidatus Limnocylindria bacterium]|nr:nucleoside hydrolase [Candidatus Limnocylindria bacterium]
MVAWLGIVGVLGPWMIAVVGLFAFVVGTTVAALASVRAGLRPGWAFVLLAAATLLILGSASGQVWFLIPFGPSSIALGVASTGVGRPARVRGFMRLPLGLAGGVVVAMVVALVALGVPARIANRAPSVPARTAALPLIHVVVNTDMLGDDWMAILYLLSEPAVDVRAITVAGTSPLGCQGATKAAQRLLAAAGHDDVPVACGQDHPLAGSHFVPPAWGADALARLETLGLPPAAEGTVDREAVELLVSTLRDEPEQVVLVALGPLTNVALAQQDAGVSTHVSRIVAMGGALNVPGNVGSNSPAEWNVYVDPKAANVVFQSRVPTTLVALDATDRVPLTATIAARLSGDQPTRAAAIVGRILAGQADFIESGQYSFWDPLAATIARDDRLARLVDERIRVIEDGPETGRTVRDEAGPTIQVAVNADAVGFERTFIDALSGRAR